MVKLAPGYDVPDFTSQISGRLESPIASGSFGEVYRITIKSSKGTMEVAAKVFKIDNRRTTEKIQHAMRRELKVWLKLSEHSTIVPLLGIAHVGSPLPALISQWMSSETLYIYLEKQGTITASAKVELARGVADGLKHLHSKNVVHGDLHPGNVLIDCSGRPRLTDFGLATVAGDAELQLNTTTAGRNLNPQWRAPEVVIGINPEDGPVLPTIKSDLYSFGGVMFFIVSGVIPWKEKKSSYLIIVELSKRATPARPDNILDDHWNLIQRCWSWDPVGRPEVTEVIKCIAPKTTSILGQTEIAGSTIQTIPPKMAANGTKDDTTFSMSDTTARQEELQLNRHHSPPKTHKIIVLFGESGAGKSSLVNLMAGKEVATTSPDSGMQHSTMQWQEYTIDFGGDSYKVFETVGLDVPHLDLREYLESVENAYRFIKELDTQGGIDLLLFCVPSGKISVALLTNYRFFHEFLCEKKVPIVLAITNLEREERMEDWWERNEGTFKHRKIDVAGHACITAANKLDGRHKSLYEESRATIRDLVERFTADGQKQAWIGGDNLFVSLMRELKLLVRGSSPVKRKDLVPHLTKRLGMSQEVAKQLADMIKQDAA